MTEDPKLLLQKFLECEPSSLEVVAEMYKRKEILAKHPIKFIEKQQRYYARLNGSYKSPTFKKSKKELEDLIYEKFKNELDGKPTITSIWTEFTEYRKLHTKDRSKDDQAWRLFIKDSKLATIPLTDIKFNDMDDFFRHCKTVKPDIKQKYFNSQKGVVSALFNYAIMNGLMTVNYAEHYKVDEEHFQPATTHNDEERIFSSAEKEVIFGLAKSSNNVYDLGICLLFYTGLRIGELCAVKWEDVTESNGNFYLAVKRELVEDVKKGTRSGKIIVDHCKSKNGIRQVPLNSEAIQLLKEIKRMNVKLEFPVFSDDFIFLRRNNNTDFNITFCTDRTFDSRLRTLCKQANMKYIKSPHDIRRTYATNLHYCGIKLKTIQKWMGHSTLEQTMEYVHFDDTTENTECLCNKVQQIQPTIKKVATLDF